MLDTSIKVKTNNFDGPLSLLLHLIQKEEMDIRSMDLTTITKQYLDYLSEMKELNFDLAGNYLYLAATLLLIKSKNCVTDEEDLRIKEDFKTDENLNITSEAELIKRLEELNHFKKMGEKLWDIPKLGHEVFTKPKINRKELANSILVPMDLEKLTSTMMDFLFKEKRKYTVVKRDRLSIKEKLQFMKEHFKEGSSTGFEELVNSGGGKNIDNIVITFISLLELARLKHIEINQNQETMDIEVFVKKSLDELDVEAADGFEEEADENEANAVNAEDLIELAKQAEAEEKEKNIEEMKAPELLQ